MRYRQTRPARPKQRSKTRHWLTSFIAVVVIIYLGATYLAAPASAIVGTPAFKLASSNSPGATTAWPDYGKKGQAAIGTLGGSVLAVHGNIHAAPIASIGKMMTALSVLQAKPLKPGQQGPTITITRQDQKKYDWYYVRDGSLAAIKVGEKISEYKALEAMLLPSANNFAYTLARWAYGSIDNYTAYANNYAAQLGLTDSHFVDASGFNPGTVSSATDLVKLGQLVMQNPILSKIVAKHSAVVPVAGKIYNVNWMLASDKSVVGIKTGNTEQAGGCMLFAAKDKVGDKNVIIIGAVMGAPKLNNALADSLKLLHSVQANLHYKTIVQQGQVVGRYKTAWGKSADVIAAQPIKVLTMPGAAKTPPTIDLKPLGLPAQAGSVVGQVKLGSGANATAVNAKLKSSIPAPSWSWRLKNPIETIRLAT